MVLTTEAYRVFVDATDLKTIIPSALAAIDVDRPESVDAAAQRIRSAFESTPFPTELRAQTIAAYEEFVRRHAVTFSAVRSSSTAEDLEGASFAGLQETYLNVTGVEEILLAIRKCWGSLFTPRVLVYRQRKGFDHSAVRLAVLIQKMVNATVSGILFTRDPNTGENHMIVEAGWGLGEAIVGGEVTPDHYVIDGASQKIVHKQISEQKMRVVRAQGGGNLREDVPVAERSVQKLPDPRLLRLVSLARLIESTYRRPMDVEWCADAEALYIVQARPVTTIPTSTVPAPSPGRAGDVSSGEAGEAPLLRGFGAAPGVAGGVARILRGSTEMEKLRPGEILVTTMTTPDMVPAMSRAAGIVTDEGGMTCHAAIVSRELGVPCVVGTRQATKLIVEGSEVTVDGKTGAVYRGLRAPSKGGGAGGAEAATALSAAHHHAPVTATKIYVNVGVPEKAEEYARLPVSGVGLLRIEFIFTAHVRDHPLALIKRGKRDELVRRLAEGVGKVCQAFHPRPVIIRTSDFKTNEYRGMPGGEPYEPVEENPMIGWRGCSRYISPVYRPAFECELEAIHRVRTEMGLKNAMVMLPFVPEHLGARGDRRDAPRCGPEALARLQALPDGGGPFHRLPRPRVREALRRILHRVERPHPARSGRGPRLGDARADGLLRRTRPRGARGDPPADPGRARGGPDRGHLRPGTERLPGVRRVPRARGYRFDLPQRRHRALDDRHDRFARAADEAGRSSEPARNGRLAPAGRSPPGGPSGPG